MQLVVSQRYLLDTCVVSEIPKPAPDQHVALWLSQHRQTCLLSSVSIGEIEYGLHRMPPGARRLQLLAWFEALCKQFGEGILACDLPVWREFARLKRELELMGRPQEDMDLLIAATAITHNLTLVTRNTKDFHDTGCKLINPWAETTKS